MFRRLVSAIAAVLGLVVIGLAVCSATVWRPSETVHATLATAPAQNYVLVEPGVLGLVEGSHNTFELPAGSVFGEVDPARQQWVPCSELGESAEADDARYVGEVLQFTLPDGHTRVSAIVAARDDAHGANEPRVLLDFNHPLAGQALTFEVQIIGIL